jgi:hypothetical protein
MNKLKELYVYTKKKGLNDTLKRIYSNYFHILTFILYKRDLNDGFSGIMLDPKFRCAEGNLELLKKERQLRKDLPREFYVDQTHGGKLFYLVYYRDELAYIHWIFRKGEYSRFFKIQDESTIEFNYNVTLPKFRGNRLQAKTMNYICEDLKNKGYKMVVGAVSTGNILSMKGMARTGLKEFKRVKSFFSYVKKVKIV